MFYMVSNFKLGRKPRSFNTKIPHMKAFLNEAALPPLPASIDWTKGITEWGMMKNDTLGCCTVAAYFHAKQIWSLNSGNEITESDNNVLKMYEEADGYVLGDPDTDQGGNEQNVLTYLLNTGAPAGNGGRDKILAFVEIDTANLDAVKRTIVDCGVAYIGFNVPNSLMDNGEPASVWEVDPNDGSIEGGHAIVLTGFNDIGFTLISWGAVYTMTYNFFQTFVDEVYAICSPDWLAATGNTPLGMTAAQLEALMTELKE